MLARDITYEDFNGDKVTEKFYFNLTRTELVEMEASYGDGFQEHMNRIIKANDRNAIITEFKKIILFTYGKKSEDGKRFIKSDEIRDEFAQTAAYDALFMELSSNENAAADFINGVMPKSVVEEAAKQQNVFDKSGIEKAAGEMTLPPPPARTS